MIKYNLKKFQFNSDSSEGSKYINFYWIRHFAYFYVSYTYDIDD